VRVWLIVEGGFAFFPGRSAPLEVDSTQLAVGDALELLDALGAACFFERLEEATPVVPDARRYIITAEDVGRSRTLRFTDPVQDASLETLLVTVRRLAKP
jgi:hypothetical protein